MKNNHKKVAIIGLGYVGLPLALLGVKKRFLVTGIDINLEKVELINKKITPFADKKIAKQLKKYPIKATTDFSEIKNVSTVVICVPTPVYKDRTPNYEPIENACQNIAPFLKKGQLIVLESTVNPGVCEEMILPILEKYGLKGEHDFYLAHCPERINPGDKKWDVSNLPRVVGGLGPKSLKKALNFYSSVIAAPIKPMNSLMEAEAVKIVENSFRNINIAFVNELARSFSKLKIDVKNVIDGAATKPFAFMAHYPSCGIGGHCIPVDPYYLIAYSKKKNGFEHEFLSLACKINEEMPHYTVNLLEKELNNQGISIDKAKVAVLGLAYKANIDDCRESPSFEIIKILKNRGAQVITYDPYVLEKSDKKNLSETLKNINGVIIATDHSAFKNIKPAEIKKSGAKVLVDGKNCLDKDRFIKKGFIYRGIGR